MTWKTRPYDEDAPDPVPASFGALMAPNGVMSVVPRPLGVGRPKPEPDERWTLGPGYHEPGADDAERRDAMDTDAPADVSGAEDRPG